MIDTLIDIADDPSSDGYASQVAINDPLPHPWTRVREIPVDADNRFSGHAPRSA
ncbi:hypothetical protein [Streptomyces sp. WELS2]|uniref:hypothetical protein n=1 Tax=Streptomyces sp. WELS2 TaxID=2749435 RepID=UPI0015F120F4|nr:hypothetical protein [Streptomyces sp. WELS2]